MNQRKNRLLASILKEAQVNLTKGKWTALTTKQKKELANDLFNLVKNAYSSIGGHLKIKSPSDVSSNQYSHWDAIDLDNDNQADAATFGKKTSHGLKAGGFGHDGSSTAKSTVLARTAKALKTQAYSEMSGKMAEIMLNKFNAPYVSSQKQVEDILGKKVQWFGAHPQNKFPNINGWYMRSIGGEKHLKIMLGKPR